MGAHNYAGAAEAQTRIARAERRLGELEQAGDSFDAIPEPQEQQQYQQPVQQSPVDAINRMTSLMPSEREWLMSHQELIADPRRVQELQATYYQAERAGLQRGSPEYFEFFEDRLDLSGSGEAERPRPAPQRRRLRNLIGADVTIEGGTMPMAATDLFAQALMASKRLDTQR